MADVFKFKVKSLQLYSLQKQQPKKIQDLAESEGLKKPCYQTVFLLESIIILPLQQLRG